MLAEWRLLHDGINEARHHFAVEEALARLVDEGHFPPTLRMRQVATGRIYIALEIRE